MTKKSGRTLLLFGMIFAFVCLLLSGGSRLVAGEGEENPIPVRTYASIRAVLTGAPEQRAETVCAMRRSENEQRMHGAPAPDHQVLDHSVTSDANGNVLAAGTYMRAVYQAFVLDDGFV